jgi:hypothetical protein
MGQGQMGRRESPGSKRFGLIIRSNSKNLLDAISLLIAFFLQAYSLD